MLQEVEHGLCWGSKYYTRLERVFGLEKGHFYSRRKALEATIRPLTGKTIKIMNADSVGVQFLSELESQIGKPVLSVNPTRVQGKYVATAGDGSVYEITVTTREVYRP